MHFVWLSRSDKIMWPFVLAFASWHFYLPNSSRIFVFAFACVVYFSSYPNPFVQCRAEFFPEACYFYPFLWLGRWSFCWLPANVATGMTAFVGSVRLPPVTGWDLLCHIHLVKRCCLLSQMTTFPFMHSGLTASMACQWFHLEALWVRLSRGSCSWMIPSLAIPTKKLKVKIV
jgi:hypothetical protein